MSKANRAVLIGSLLGLLVLSSTFAAATAGFLRPSAAGPGPEPAQATSISYEFYDFFNVPYGEWWDYRYGTYGDLPINAECFNATAIANHVCNPSNASVKDYEDAPPYTNWYPLPGPTGLPDELKWNHPGNSPMIYAPYRFNVAGVNVPGYNRSEPVFLPILDYAAPPGNRLEFDWEMHYLDTAEGNYLMGYDFTNPNPCSGVDPSAYDGFYIRSQIGLTMDMQQSRRMFGVTDTVTFSPARNPLGGAGTWSNPANGFTSNNLYTSTSSASATPTQYGTYVIPTTAATSPILSVEIGLEGYTAGDDDVRVDFSTDNAVTWTTAGTVNLGTTDTTTFFNVTLLRSWTFSMLSDTNFRTRIVYVQQGGTASAVNVDWIPVRVKSDAAFWWAANTAPGCTIKRPAERNVENWFVDLGGTSSTAGKYDIQNSFEWYYQSYFLNMTATVDPDGTTRVFIDHAAWGTEVVLARMFYWGNTSYLEHHLDSTKARGWWGMELAWFENFRFAGSLGAPGGGFDFTLSSAMHYHFQQAASAGPNGLFDRTDDVPLWTWGPVLTDYTNDYSAGHLASELDRYPYPYYSYVHSTPGGITYGKDLKYDYAPLRWDLAADQSWHFQFPTGDVVFYDPNETPVPANPQGGFAVDYLPMSLDSMFPSTIGTWDAPTATWTVHGPISTGGPEGSPGPDGVPGTGDDRYALAGYPSIIFRAASIDVRVTAPWIQLYVGQTMDLTVTATAGGTALPGAAVAATVTSNGALTSTSGTTDAAGMWKTTVRPLSGSVGTTIRVSVSVSKAPYGPGAGTYDINVISALSADSIATSGTREMMSFETARIEVRITDSTTLVGVAGALLTPSTRFGGTFSAVSDLGGGSYAFGWNAPAVTTQSTASISVTAKAGGYIVRTASIGFTVDPNMTRPDNPTQLYDFGVPSTTTLRSGETITVTVYVYTAEGYAVTGAGVIASLRFPTQGTVSASTDRLNGVYTFTYTAATFTTPTLVTIKIDCSKYGYRLGTTRVSVTVNP